MKGTTITWQSPCCACSVFLVVGRKPRYKLCSIEHIPWSSVILPKELDAKLTQLAKVIKRGVPRSFEHILERYSKGDPSFHRPKELPFNPEALDAAMGLFIHESLGMSLAETSEPALYATYLAGKATQGLTEKMYLESAWHDLNRSEGCALFFPEEYVTSGDIDLKAAEAMFLRPMDAELLWVTGDPFRDA